MMTTRAYFCARLSNQVLGSVPGEHPGGAESDPAPWLSTLSQ